MKWRRVLGIGALILVVAVAILWVNAWAVLGRMQESRDASAEVVVRHLRGTVHLIEATRDGARPFSYVAALASIGPDGAFLVDPMVSAALGGKIEALLVERGSAVRYVANTHAHPDHTRGNVAFADGPHIIAHEAASLEMAQSLEPFAWLPATKPLPAAALPDVTFTEGHTVELNGERIHMRHFGPAHTAGDAFIFFENARVVHAGDTFLGGGGRAVAAPISGGTFEGLELALGAMVAAAPADAIVVGGHGELGKVWTIADVERYRAVLREGLDWVARARTSGEPTDEDFEGAVVPRWEEWSGGESPQPLLRAIWNADRSH
jgi:glyoxylase-like metal-dependent hydrolase (beta-lactamase superfamily II)